MVMFYDGQGFKGIDDVFIVVFMKKYLNVMVKLIYDLDNVMMQNQFCQFVVVILLDLIWVISVVFGVKNDLLMNFDLYVMVYGWDKFFILQLFQFCAKDGVVGLGSLYVKLSGFMMIGFYYDKVNVAKIGMINLLVLVEEFIVLMVKVKLVGLVLMVVYNKEGGGVFLVQLLFNLMLGLDKVVFWVFNVFGATIDILEVVKVAQQVVDWNKVGYFFDGVNGFDVNVVDVFFVSGKVVFFLWGNWDVVNIDKMLLGKVGFILMLLVTVGGQVGVMLDVVIFFGILLKLQNKDVVVLFFNFLFSDEVRQIVVDNGFMLSGIDDQVVLKILVDLVKNDVVVVFKQVFGVGGQMLFVQNVTVGISNQVWIFEIQFLLGGKSMFVQYLVVIQVKYESELG